jgi:hypothetical protein
MPKKLPVFFLFMLLANALFADATVITSSFNPPVVTVGQDARFVITVKGSSSGRLEGDLPQVQGLITSTVPDVSSRTEIINFDVSSFTQYSYSCRPAKEGTYTIPAYTVTIGGDKYTVPSATLTAAKPGKEVTDAALLEVEAPAKLYVGQSAPATVRLLIRGDIETRQGDILLPRRSGDGLTQDQFDVKLAEQGRVIRNVTTPYNFITLTACITALNPGKHVLAYDSDVRLRFPRRTSGSLDGIDDPMERMMRKLDNGMFDESNADISIVHPHGEAPVEVLPLPPDAPKSFDGAVGSFSVSGGATSRVTKVGEPIEVDVDIQTEGGLKSITPPKADQSAQWRAYPPSEDGHQNDKLGLNGGKKYKFLFSPQVAGELMTPTLRFAYLDPATGKYVEKVLPGEKIAVADVPGMNAPPPPAVVTAAPVLPQPQKKAHAALNTDGFHPISLLDTPASSGALQPPQKQKTFIFAQILPALILAWGVAAPIMRRRAGRDPLAKIRRSYAKAASKARIKSLAAAKKGDAATFFAQGRECLQNAVCARDPARRPETVSAADVIQLLGDDAQTLRRDANTIFNGSEALHYGGATPAPNELEGALDALAAKLGVK